MSEPVHTTETPATDAPEQPDVKAFEGAPDPSKVRTPDGAEPKPTETVDYWKQRARQNEAQAKANAEAARKLKEIEDRDLSELERARRDAQEAASQVAEAKAEAMRFRVAAANAISDEDAETFLTGTTEDQIKRQAERLVALRGARSAGPRPDPSQGAKSGAPISGREAGLAEAQRRFGTPTPTQ